MYLKPIIHRQPPLEISRHRLPLFFSPPSRKGLSGTLCTTFGELGAVMNGAEGEAGTSEFDVESRTEEFKARNFQVIDWGRFIFIVEKGRAMKF